MSFQVHRKTLHLEEEALHLAHLASDLAIENALKHNVQIIVSYFL